MSSNFEPTAELVELLQALIDDTINLQQHEQLQQLLGKSPETQKYFLEWMQLHGTLQWDSANLSAFSENLQDKVRDLLPSAQESKTQQQSAMHVSTRMSWTKDVFQSSHLAWFALAGSLLFCLAWIGQAFLTQDSSEVLAKLPVELVGIVQSLEAAEWSGASQPDRVGEPISSGRLTLKSGTARIETFQGASLTLTAPCDMTFESADKVDCHQGRLLVSVLREDAKLRVTTPVGELLHIGTEFGIDVASPGATELYVFDGAVELRSSRQQGSADSARVIPQGTAIRVETSGKVAAIEPDKDLSHAPEFHRETSVVPFEPEALRISDAGFQVRYVKSSEASMDGLAQADALL
ncbi:MAG: FecR family protein, partial [Pirellulales bacterium]|nr:FecR family protein [Pirellulales bacterium]